MKGRRIVFDIEADNLLPGVTRIWIFVAYDIDSKEFFIFNDYDSDVKPLSELLEFLDTCETLIGHNILQYDLLVLEKLLGWRPRHSVRLIDTMVMSQVLDYMRFGFGHSLKRWGEFFKFPKVEHEDWTQYSSDMRNRCVIDVELNKKVYDHLINEMLNRKHKEALSKGIRVECSASYFVGRAQLYGWPFDREKAVVLLNKIEARMNEIKNIIEPKLKTKCVQVDKDPEYKSPAWVANGNYAVRTCGWFNIPPEEGLDNRPIFGDYCRVEFESPEIGSLESVKEYLYSIGWEPDEWNYKDIPGGGKIKTTPKLTEESLKAVGPDGELIDEYTTIRARHSIVKTWVEENITENNRLHGDCFVIGTPTGRARHSIIANIPKGSTAYGKEVKELFTTLPGYKIVGADSASNQARALAHYLDNPAFTDTIINGDIHSMNRDILESIVGKMKGDARDKAKKFYYAFLFGGGGGKLALIITDKRDVKLGSEIKEKFLKSIPGLKELISKLEKQFKLSKLKTKKSYILALDGRPIYVPSEHKALNYLLQSAEKITCSAAIHLAVKWLEEAKIDYQPLIMYHDEIEIMVREDQAEEASRLCKLAFAEGPKIFGVTIMDGDSKIGNNWYEVH